MTEYPIKRGQKLDDDLIRETMKECFGCDAEMEDGKFVISYKSLKRMEAWLDGKQLCVHTESNMDADLGDVSDANRCFRRFLESTTGFTAKQRTKKMKKS
ncbi:MAG: DUF5611 family protein [Euryarchaeota archaeon]|nr:DUF5611 family protein [Euryarchaeota archaeon]